MADGKLDKDMRRVLDKVYLKKPLMVLLFASPLVDVDTKRNKTTEMDLLDYTEEFRCTIDGLKNTGSAIEIKKMLGTLTRFQHVLTDNPVGLHFSGHGDDSRDNGFLVFENNDGSAHKVYQ